jgi:insertion element IS1 protein InsB
MTMWHRPEHDKVRAALGLEGLGSCYRATGGLGCGGRDKATCERLLERLTRWRTRLYCADDYAVYDVLLPAGQRYDGKDETHGIERDNARQRHWLARFRRRSIVVSKAKRMVDVSIALYAASPETTGSVTCCPSYLCTPNTLPEITVTTSGFGWLWGAIWNPFGSLSRMAKSPSLLGSP